MYNKGALSMISDDGLLKLIEIHKAKLRNSDYILIPFDELPTVDSSKREYEWYSIRIELLLSQYITHNVFVNYVAKAICIKKVGLNVLSKWTVEIPYGYRSKYLDFIIQINRAVSKDGSVSLFISNNPYDLKCYLAFEDKANNTESINKIMNSYKINNYTEKGLHELIQDLVIGRKYDIIQIPANADEEYIKFIFNQCFCFSELDSLKKKGYDHTVNTIRKKVFISYCHADKNIVYSITDKLENSGINLWIDKKSIDYGENIARSISSGINESDLAILFLSKTMIESKFSQFELENIMSNMIKKSMGWFMVKLDDVNVNKIMPSMENYLYYDFNENKNIDNLVSKIIQRVNNLK